MLLFRLGTAKLGPSVVGQPAEKNETDMIKTSKRPTRKTVLAIPQTQTIAVIKNGMTDEEMRVSGDAWAAHTGPYLTLAEVLAIEKAKETK